MRIRQHIPSFCSGFSVTTENFETLDELFKIPFVHKWSEAPGFYRFSICKLEMYPLGKKRYSLMAEMHEGFEWWVIGYITGKGTTSLELPIWEAKKKSKEVANEPS